ncbi:MAG: tetratricopeptide repeat protein [Pseudomonadota bacterium]
MRKKFPIFRFGVASCIIFQGIQMYEIHLFGPFDIQSSLGVSCKPRSLKQSGIIALLALSPNKRRSRAWLKSVLWCEKDEESASSNLRQALRQLRRHFGPDALVSSDRYDVWLVEASCCIVPARHAEDCLLEGLDIDEEVFEDWLREERTKAETVAKSMAPLATLIPLTSSVGSGPSTASLPRLLVQKQGPIPGYASTFVEAKSGANEVLEFVCAGLATNLHEWSAAEVVDPSGTALQDVEDPGMIDYVVVLTATTAGPSLRVSARLYRAHDSTLCQSMHLALDHPLVSETGYQKTSGYVQQAATAIAGQIYQDAKTGVISNPIVFSVHDLFSPDRTRQLQALGRLASLRDHSGVAMAWLVYGQVVCLAECAGQEILLEEVQANCAYALEAAPYHPVVNALIGHINAFFFRDFSRAEELLGTARTQSPLNSMVLSHCAAAENYFGSPERGLKLAQRSIELSPNSFIRYIFDCDLQMSMALRGRHAEAAVLGERVLRTSPDFLGAKRYLMASYVQLGAFDKARKRIAEIQSLDDNFCSEGVSKSFYPLPSDRSVSLISESLARVGH